MLTGGMRLEGPYRFQSVTIKDLERRTDGILETQGHDGPIYAVEFQGQTNAGIWYNQLTKMGLYGELHPQCDVCGSVVFLHERIDPKRPNGVGTGPFTTAVYLNTFLAEGFRRDSDNPYLRCLPR